MPDTITVPVSDEERAAVDAAVAAGEYPDAGEAVRDALRLWLMDRAAPAPTDADLRRLVAKAKASGEPVDADAVFRRLLDKYAKAAAEAER